METVCLNRPDIAFTRAVEDESGQTVSRCYQCGNCSAGCPMSVDFDYTVSRVMRLIQAGQREAVLSSRAIWMCATCETCTQRCPNEIDVAAIMDTCRHMARRAGKGGVYAVKTFFDSFLSSVGMNGRTHEVGLMAMYMARTGRFWTDVDLAPKVLPKGKMAIMPHRIEGRQEVADIFRRFKEGASDEAVVRARLAARDTKIADASASPGGVMAAAPKVASAPAAAPLKADPSGAPTPAPDCGDSPTPGGWEGGTKDKEARS
jgi:heterodisulfide reductase subunit C